MFTCHYCLNSLIWSFRVKFCLWWLCQCALLLSVSESQPSVVHSFSALSLAVNGGVRYHNRRLRVTPTVVRRGQTDWLRRLLCGNLGGFAGLGYYSPAPHSSRASRLPTVQHCISPSCSLCQLSGWMCCGPAETGSWSVWWCCEVEGQFF